MAKPEMAVRDIGEARLVEFYIPGGTCTPAEFAESVRDLGEALESSGVVLLSGRGPVWGYGMLVTAARRAAVVATYDPRQDPTNRYVVVASRDARVQVGQTLPGPAERMANPPAATGETAAATDPRPHYAGLVLAVGGPPNSGKSVFVAELYRQLVQRDPFLQRGAPDGEGMWWSESNPVLANRLRQGLKGAFSPEFMNFTLDGIEQLGRGFGLVIVDLGGQRSAENAAILRRCTHLVLVSSDPTSDEAWQQFAVEQGCQPLAVLQSSLVRRPDGTLDSEARSNLDCSAIPARGVLINLDRSGRGEPYQETIGQFAVWLRSLVAGRGPDSAPDPRVAAPGSADTR
jgi:CRISPR-associated protein Csx3